MDFYTWKCIECNGSCFHCFDLHPLHSPLKEIYSHSFQSYPPSPSLLHCISTAIPFTPYQKAPHRALSFHTWIECDTIGIVTLLSSLFALYADVMATCNANSRVDTVLEMIDVGTLPVE